MEEHKKTKQYIDLDVGFYGGCSYHPTAWDETFRTLRNNFPDKPLVLIEDGRPCGVDYSDMAAKYNAKYIKCEKSIYLYWPTIEQTWTYLQWILQVSDICKTEWLVQLHPDNIVNDRYHINPPGPICGLSCGSRSGVSNNALFPKAAQYVLTKYPNIEMNGYGWAGGSCLHVPTFRKIMETFTFERLTDIKLNIDPKITENEDYFLPFLFNLYGYPYRIWLEIEEPNRNTFGSSAAFQHGNKTFYNISKSEEGGLAQRIKDQVHAEVGVLGYST